LEAALLPINSAAGQISSSCCMCWPDKSRGPSAAGAAVLFVLLCSLPQRHQQMPPLCLMRCRGGCAAVEGCGTCAHRLLGGHQCDGQHAEDHAPAPDIPRSAARGASGFRVQGQDVSRQFACGRCRAVCEPRGC
jgi:hypothetical protein